MTTVIQDAEIDAAVRKLQSGNVKKRQKKGAGAKVRGIVSVPIAEIEIGERHRKDMGDLKLLATSIKAVGLLQSIGITKGKKLVFGERRLRAVADILKRETIEARIVDVASVVVGEYTENEIRKDFAPSERVAIVETLRTHQHGGDRRSNQAQNFGLEKLTEAARGAGFRNEETYRQARRVVQKGVPELVDMMDKELVSISDAAGASTLKHARQRRVVSMVKNEKANNLKDANQKLHHKAQVKKAEKAKPPKGKFPVIVCDPPWEYRTRQQDPTHRGRTPYPTMTLDKIKAIKIPATRDCILFLWVTNAHLITGEATEALKAWSFEPKTMLTWVKNRMGIGDWLRGQTEHCVLAVRGSPCMTDVRKKTSTVLEAPVGKHSEKPDAFYKLVEELCPGARCEMFARGKRKGWKTWGAEAGGSRRSTGRKGKPKAKRKGRARTRRARP